MALIIRNRTIRPSTRLETSVTYKVDTRSILSEDTLIVNVHHETKDFYQSYKFRGSDVVHKNSISFRVTAIGPSFEIAWSGAVPMNEPVTVRSPVSKPDLIASKMSFDPISNDDIKILILGTLPGDRSLALNEYYGHSRNRFWKVMSAVTDKDLPLLYTEKKKLLLESKVGLWDVAHKAVRIGSLDSAITDEIPNDLENFISTHKHLKTIVFNGLKAEALFDKYFERRKEIMYLSLPSTSPANASINFEDLCERWRIMML